jgi:hypothetical protein
MAFDPDEFLKQEKKKPTAASIAAPAAVSDSFDPDAFLSDPANALGGTSEPSMVSNTQVPLTAPTSVDAVPQLPLTGYGPGIGSQLAQTGLGQTASAMAQPYTRAAQNVMGQYAASPLTKLAPDLASIAAGIPPPIATSQALQATQQAGSAAMRSRSAPPAMPTFQSAGPAPTSTQIAGNPMLAEMAARQAALETESLANRTMIQKLAMSKVMQTLGQVAGAVAPALNTAARVVGPVGAAMNLYEAGQMARETQLGPRLVQGQGQRAEQAFRNIGSNYGEAFRNTVSPQQARDILASGSMRDITAFGGAAFLRQRAGQ